MANPQIEQGVSVRQKTVLSTMVIGLVGSLAVLASAYAFAFTRTGKLSLLPQTTKTAVTTVSSYFVQMRSPQPLAWYGRGNVPVTVEINEDRPISMVDIWMTDNSSQVPDKALTTISTLTDGQPSTRGTFTGSFPTLDPAGGDFVPEGSIVLVAKAQVVGSQEVQYHGDVFAIRVDKTPPTVDVVEPSTTAPVPQTFRARAYVWDGVDRSGVAKVEFIVDDGPAVVGQPEPAPIVYSASLIAAPGQHMLRVRATDNAGNETTTTSQVFTVSGPDTTAPVVHLDSPTNGSRVNGTVPIYATVDDAGGVSRVEVLIDGANFGVALPVSEGLGYYRTYWNTLALAPESTHRIRVVAKDATGNSGASDESTVTVTAPAITTYIKPAFDTLAGKTSLVAMVQTDNPDQISRLDFEVRASAANDFQLIGTGKKIGCNLVNWWSIVPPTPTGPCYLITWDTATSTQTSGSYIVRAKAYTAGVNSFPSEGSMVQIDQSVFHVTMIEPAENATVSGGVYFTATANDPVLPEYSFILDGQTWLGGPNRYLFNSTTINDGVHTVQAYVGGGHYSQYQVFNVLNHPPAPGRPGQELE